MSEQYEPNSVNATLARIETMVSTALKRQEEHTHEIGKIWKALGRLDVRVAAIAGGISVLAILGKWLAAIID